MLMYIRCVNDKCYKLNELIKYGIDNGCLFVEIMPERKKHNKYITYYYPLSSILYYKVIS